MAVVTVLGSNLTNLNAAPPILNPAVFHNGKLRAFADVVTVTNGDSIASQYKFARVSTNWRMASLRTYNGAITSAAADFGLYRTARDGGAVVLAAAYGSAVSIAAASALPVDVLFEQRTIDKLRQQVFADGNLTADPFQQWDLTATLTAAATATGFLCVDAWFVIE